MISAIDPVFRNGVQGGCGLVQHQNSTVLVQRPGQQKPLNLSARKMDAIFINMLSNVGLDPLGQTVCPLENTGFL